MIGLYKKRISGLVLALLTLASLPAEASCGGCKSSLPAEVAAKIAPITVLREGKPEALALSDAGGCAGIALCFMAVRYGLDLLYGQEIPDLDDLVVFTANPGSTMDLLDKVLRGAGANNRTWPAPGMIATPDNFAFHLVRKSTMQMVEVRLKDGLWPADWFELREKGKKGTLSETEKQKLSQNRQLLAGDYPRRSFVELFGEPQVQTFAAWGHLERGETDRRVRDLRRQARGQEKE